MLEESVTGRPSTATRMSPSFTPAYTYEARIGDYNTLEGKFSATGPVVEEDQLPRRAPGAPLHLRSALVPTANIGSGLGYIVMERKK